MTWAVIIGIAIMVVILVILFPTLFRAVIPVQHFQENCANYGGVLLNDTQECNGKVAMESTIVDVQEGYICCVKKPGVPQEYFTSWKENTNIVDPSLIDATTGEVSEPDTDSDETTAGSETPDPGAIASSQELLPGSITGHFYSRQRNNEHFCFLGVQAHTNPDQDPFALGDVRVNLAWGQNQAGCLYDEEIIAQTPVDLTTKQSYKAADSLHKVPCLSFTLGGQELGLHLDNIENSLPVRCDTFIIGSHEDIIESFFFSGTAVCGSFSEDSCLDYSLRPSQELWFSLNCHLANTLFTRPHCESCTGVRSCQDYDTKSSCEANQCLISNFAYEDTDCFWVPKKISKPDGNGDCYRCESCANYKDETTCLAAKEYCDVGCFWTPDEVCVIA